MNHTTTTLHNDSNVISTSNNINDSLARLYATAKQLDTVTSLDRTTNDIEDNDHHHNHNTFPVVVRRERSVSDTELFHVNKTTLPSIPVVEMAVSSHHYNNDTMMMVVDDPEGEDDMDEIIPTARSDDNHTSHPKQRMRSASCGNGATNTNTSTSIKKAVVSLSPSHHSFCETIVEEEL
jgi:hypothetical protein